MYATPSDITRKIYWDSQNRSWNHSTSINYEKEDNFIYGHGTEKKFFASYMLHVGQQRLTTQQSTTLYTSHLSE